MNIRQMNKHRAVLSYKKKWAWWRNNDGILIMWNTKGKGM